MSSAVRKLQTAVAESIEPLTPLLRQAKVIAASLGLEDVETWVDLELKGYPQGKTVPAYRMVTTGHVEIYNPYQGGWVFAGHYRRPFPVFEPVSGVEELAKDGDNYFTMNEQIPMRNQFGERVQDKTQRIMVPSAQFKDVVEGIRNELLQWTVELTKRGIKGENMDFSDKEKAAATHQTFHIQKFTGVLGNVSGSSINVYDYNSLHQTLKENNVPQAERNELENIMDELKKASPEQKQGWLEKGKSWVVKNKEFLGASAEIVRKALGT